MDSSVSSSIDYEADIGKSSLVPIARRSLLPRAKSEVRAGVLTMMAIRGGSARKGYLFQASTYSAKTGKDFGAKSGSIRARMAKLWQFLPGHPNPHFLKKGKRGPREIFQKSPRK